MARVRLDTLIYNKGMASSREKARGIILAGEVQVNGKRIDKPGTSVAEEADIVMQSSRPRYVSRGGLKLEKAIEDFQIDFNGQTVLDVGASTGGYTDCALKNGAVKVFALDVGYGQLDWSLRNDPRVVNIERKNIRHFSLEELGEQVDIITMDVSFISTTLVFPVIKNLLKDNGKIISLIKPQFEAGKDKVGKKGVVRDPAVHREVILNCIKSSRQEALYCTGVSFSPICGPQGNIEYFICLRKVVKPGQEIEDVEIEVDRIVEEANRELGGKK